MSAGKDIAVKRRGIFRFGRDMSGIQGQGFGCSRCRALTAFSKSSGHGMAKASMSCLSCEREVAPMIVDVTKGLVSQNLSARCAGSMPRSFARSRYELIAFLGSCPFVALEPVIKGLSRAFRKGAIAVFAGEVTLSERGGKPTDRLAPALRIRSTPFRKHG